MLIRPLVLLALIAGFVCAEDHKPEAAAGQQVAAHPAPPADPRAMSPLAKQALAACDEYWAIVKDNMKAGITGFSQKDMETNPRAKMSEEARKRMILLQHDALVEYFSIADRRVVMPENAKDAKHEAGPFNLAIKSYPWSSNRMDNNAPHVAGLMYGRAHKIDWLVKLSLNGGEGH